MRFRRKKQGSLSPQRVAVMSTPLLLSTMKQYLASAGGAIRTYEETANEFASQVVLENADVLLVLAREWSSRVSEKQVFFPEPDPHVAALQREYSQRHARSVE